MTVRELYERLNKKIPQSLSCEWDNDGLMCCPIPNRQARKILVTLDISEEAVNFAISEGCDLIVSHHPLVFKPVKALTTESGVPRKLIRLIENGISAMSFHTRFDALEGGVNDVLARIIGMENVETFGENGELIGRVGFVKETTLQEFAVRVKDALGSPMVLYNGDRPVRRVAVVGGNGDDFVSAAKRADADTLVSGRQGYHVMADAKENGINLIEAGHYFTEAPSLEALAGLVKAEVPDAETVFFASNNIRAV